MPICLNVTAILAVYLSVRLAVTLNRDPSKLLPEKPVKVQLNPIWSKPGVCWVQERISHPLWVLHSELTLNMTVCQPAIGNSRIPHCVRKECRSKANNRTDHNGSFHEMLRTLTLSNSNQTCLITKLHWGSHFVFGMQNHTVFDMQESISGAKFWVFARVPPLAIIGFCRVSAEILRQDCSISSKFGSFFDVKETQQPCDFDFQQNGPWTWIASIVVPPPGLGQG